GRERAADVIGARREIEARALAEQEIELDERLRGDAVMVVALAQAADRAAGGIADASERGALDGQRVRRPPLRRGAERHGGARDAVQLRRDVVVAAPQAPHAAVRRGAFAVALPGDQPAAHDALEGGGRARGEAEVEVVERPGVAI